MVDFKNLLEKEMTEKKLKKGEPIDWDNPFDSIRSSELTEISLKFLDNGEFDEEEDEKTSEYYRVYKFDCIRLDVPKKNKILYTTSAKTLINALKTLMPIKGKSFKINKPSGNFPTYTVIEIK